jgi:hypothetical protein
LEAGFASAAEMAAANAAANGLAAIAILEGAKKMLEIARNNVARKGGKDPCEAAKAALRQLERSVKSFENRVSEHQNWIKDPSSYKGGGRVLPGDPRIPNWINDWTEDIVKNKGELEKAKKAVEMANKLVDKACKCWYKPWTWFN